MEMNMEMDMAKVPQSLEYNGIKYTLDKKTPNTSGLADLVFRAKGVNRSWRQFSQECKTISPATFTRILNGGYKKPLPFDMLKTIVDHADSGTMITMKEALFINGYRPQEDSSPNKTSAQKKDADNSASENDVQDEVNCVFEIISKTLFSKKIAFSLFPEEADNNSDFINDIGLYDLERDLSPWMFTLHIQNYKPYYIKYIHTIIHEEAIDNEKDFMVMLKRFFVIFLRDSWEQQATADTLYSFVFKTQRVYDMFIELINKVKVNNFFSAVLIDTEQRTVVDEHMFPQKHGIEAMNILMS